MKFAFLVPLAMLVATSHAASIIIGGFSSARADTASVAEGPFAEDLRDAVITAYPGSAFIGLDALTPAALSGVDYLIIGAPTFGMPIMLSSGEQAALLAFIKAGHGAFIFLDNDSYAGVPTSDDANESFLDPFLMDSTGRIPNVASATSIAPNHPVMEGPFGTVSTVATSYGGWLGDLGPHATALATYDPNGRTALAVIPPGALAPGSGPVVFLGDADAIVDSADGGLFKAAGNEALLLNSVAYAVPEPSTTALLACMVICLARGPARRRSR